jgi:hypothetical protein
MPGWQEWQGYQKPMKSTGATVPLLFKTPRKPLETWESVALFHVRSHHTRLTARKRLRSPGRGLDSSKPPPCRSTRRRCSWCSCLASCFDRRYQNAPAGGASPFWPHSPATQELASNASTQHGSRSKRPGDWPLAFIQPCRTIREEWMLFPRDPRAPISESRPILGRINSPFAARGAHSEIITGPALGKCR